MIDPYQLSHSPCKDGPRLFGLKVPNAVTYTEGITNNSLGSTSAAPFVQRFRTAEAFEVCAVRTAWGGSYQ